ncbi:MAG TPA: L-rhamnose mutarotase [Clostridiaceae bacterium]|nr:L-rhamnose mutarotase [Clostridiaceae bacterium]
MRIAQAARLKAEKRDEYLSLHANPWPEVLDRLTKSHVENYSIYLAGDLVFAYFEYTGDDYEADMAAIAADEATQRWWARCVPCLDDCLPDAGPTHWANLPEIFRLD